MRVLICGGGVIGASIAYFLAAAAPRPIVIERTGVACAASGKSGGFLALDWCDGTPARGAGAPQLRAAREPRRDDRRRLGLPPPGHLWRLGRGDTARGAGARRRTTSPGCPTDVNVARRLGSPATTAQVHPGAVHDGA